MKYFYDSKINKTNERSWKDQYINITKYKDFIFSLSKLRERTSL